MVNYRTDFLGLVDLNTFLDVDICMISVHILFAYLCNNLQA